MIVGHRPDHTGDLGTVPVAAKLCLVGVDEICGDHHIAQQIRMLRVGARIDDRNLHAVAAGHRMRIGHIHLLKAALQPDIRIVIA